MKGSLINGGRASNLLGDQYEPERGRLESQGVREREREGERQGSL